MNGKKDQDLDKGVKEMGKIKEALHWLYKLLFGGSLYLLGGWSKTLGAMLIFIIVDYVSGYLKSVYKKDLQKQLLKVL